MSSREHHRRARKAYCINFLRAHGYEVKELPEISPPAHRRIVSRWACRLVNTPEMIARVREYVQSTGDGPRQWRLLKALERQSRGEATCILFGWYMIGKDWNLCTSVGSTFNWKNLYPRIKYHERNSPNAPFFVFYY